jgi:mannose-6-phosphate isomerase-like protein (cupin superfamily)
MDKLSKAIMKEILPEEKEVLPVPATQRSTSPTSVDHWSPAVLLERASYLRKMALYGSGAASEVLQEFSRHCAQLLVRCRDGEAEVHDHFADVFYVLEGRATLETGGSVTGAKTVAPGETRGTALERGHKQELRAGEVAHVSAGVPHRMLIPGDQTTSFLVLKIEEELTKKK